MFSQNDLQELLDFKAGEDGQVLSVYLNADTGQETREAIKLRVRSMLREVDANEEDSHKVEAYLSHAHDWSSPGLALFSCASKGFFRAYPTAVAFRSRARLGKRPYVKPLAHLLDYYAHYGVILIDRVGARFFEYHLGELQASGEVHGEDIRKLKHGSGSSAAGMRGGVKGARQEEEAAHRNLREAAAEATRFFKRRNVRRLFIGGTSQNVAQFRDLLPKQLQSCIAGTFPISMEASENEVRDRALALLRETNAEREQKLVAQLVTVAAKGGNAVAGVDDTLQAVSDGRVDTLVIVDGLRMPGYLHEPSGFVTANLIYSPYSKDELARVDDVIETAVAQTMSQGGHVEVVSDCPQLEEVGKIGALLRY